MKKVKREEDRRTDEQLHQYVSLDSLQSFLLLAGAGSGKTRSLVSMLEYLRKEWKDNLKITGRKIAVITFTKAASEEIQARISYDSSFHISTIHSFAWELIKPFQTDIKEYLIEYYENKLREENCKRKSKNHEERIKKYENKLLRINKISRFNYSPDTNIIEKEFLSHSEVIQIMTSLLNNKTSFKRIMIQKYPVLLIDECQDTDRELLTTFIKVEKEFEKFCLVLIGDMMQRVYAGGVVNLLEQVDHWNRFPQKEMNWRSQKRIVDFLNTLRIQTDPLRQSQNKDKEGGIVRIYIINDNVNDYQNIEVEAKVKHHFEKMIGNNPEVMTLILEHQMAAKRNGFFNLFRMLNNNGTTEALKDSSGKEMNCVKNLLLPFADALQSKTEFKMLRLLRKENILDNFDNSEKIEELKYKIESFQQTLDENTTLRDIVKYIRELNITELPDAFLTHDESDPKVTNWQKVLDESLEEFKNYFDYKNEQSPYITQQGSKGLEYDNVLVIMNDSEVAGNMFSYGKIIGTISPTLTDEQNISEGKDNSIERTKRLLYVASSRARESLGLVIYTSNINRTKDYFIENSLVNDEEIITEEYL